jgi:hypothetical protein
MFNKAQYFRIFLAGILASSILLTGCSGPKDYEVTKLTAEQRTELGKKLTSEEGQKLSGWMFRNVISGKEPAVGLTVRQAIKDQETWLAKEKEDEIKAAELKNKVEAERKAKQAEFDKLVTVTLINKKNAEHQYGQKFINFDMAYQNKGDKDIAGIKGTLKITDMFGDKIMNVGWSYDGGVAANKMSNERNSGVSVNEFKDNDMKLWNTDFDKIKSKFEVSTIIFKDGSKVDVPE